MNVSEPLFPPRGWAPALVTAANVALGFLSMLAATEGRFTAAVYFLMLAIILDGIDGRLARQLGATSRLGQQLDSFSDAISFGVAPAFLVYRAALMKLELLGSAIALVFLMAGIYRLARFNLLADAHAKDRRTLGVPIPVGASYLMAAVLMRDELPVVATAGVVLFFAYGMASRWQLPEMKGANLVSALMAVGVVNYLLVVFVPSWNTIIWWNLWNVVILLAARREDRQLGLDEAALR